jgi:aromatic ring-cleaving dioxygenase
LLGSCPAGGMALDAPCGTGRAGRAGISPWWRRPGAGSRALTSRPGCWLRPALPVRGEVTEVDAASAKRSSGQGAALSRTVQMLKFHAHVFFDPGDAEHARAISAELPGATGATVTSWLDRPGGPLPQAQFQIELTSAELGTVTEWLMLHREGLSMLLHPETGDDLLDHTAHAAWLGTPLELRLDREPGGARPRTPQANQARAGPQARWPQPRLRKSVT